MNKFIYKLYKFMYGRYGIDELYKFGLFVCVLIAIINLFINSRLFSLIELFIIIVLIYRSMSKNIIRRKYENKKYLNLKRKINNKFNLIKRRWNDRYTHIYRKCPKCKTVVRLPLKKGKHMCKCPICHNKFEVKCRRDEKIKVEVIKNNNS